jgi:2-polyprenyl-3-methyl-5-hydroxy-6-metoxy-1,4-benzoquinol methylase
MKCPACNSTRCRFYRIHKDNNKKLINKEVVYHECEDCKLLFISPQPKEELLELYKKGYRDKLSLKQKIIFFIPYSKHFKYSLFYIKKFIKSKNKSVLDIGSSEGKFLKIMKMCGWKVLGIEPTIEYAKFSNNVLKVPTKNITFEKFETKNKFSLVTLIHTLEHIYNPLETIKKVKTILSDNGKLFIVVPSRATERFASTHLFLHTKESLKRLVERGGFNISRIIIKDNIIYLIAYPK